jgi:hypothetical protein
MLTSGLNLQLFAAFLEGRQSLLGVARQVNMHASSHTCVNKILSKMNPYG